MNWENRALKILNYTHCDLDGATSGIVIKNYYNAGKVETRSINYNKESALKDVIEREKEKYDGVIFTDFMPSNIRELKKINISILVLDHHETAKVFNDPKNDIIIMTKYCGAMLAYKYFNRHNELDHLKDIVEITNDYDMWILKDKRSMFFNALYWDMGFKWFMSRFIGGNIELYKEEKNFLIEYKKDYKDYYDNLPITELSNKGVLFECDKYMSELSENLRNDGYEWLIIKHNEQLSLRTSRDDLDLTIVCKIIGKGGGHTKSVGISIGYDNLNTLVKKIEQAVETALSASYIV